MRRLLILAGLAACGGPSRQPAILTPPPADAAVATAPAVITVVLPTNVGVAVACRGDVDGVAGGLGCFDDPPGQPVAGCTDAHGALRGDVLDADDMLQPFTLLGDGVQHVRSDPTDPRDKREHQVDLDSDGTADAIALVPHDNRASYGRSLVVTDGHDPLMSDTYDPFPDAADLQLLGTSDVDGDGRRELILYAPDEDGFGIAVQEYWAPAEAYRLDCRNP